MVHGGAPERVPALVDSEEAAELGDRLGVVVDAQVADAVDALAGLGGRALALDDDGGRLLAARVAAGGLTGLERGDEPVRELACGLEERALHLLGDGLAGEDVPLHRVARPSAMAGPREAAGAGEGGRLAGGGHRAELPRLALAVAGEHPLDRLGRGG